MKGLRYADFMERFDDIIEESKSTGKSLDDMCIDKFGWLCDHNAEVKQPSRKGYGSTT